MSKLEKKIHSLMAENQRLLKEKKEVEGLLSAAAGSGDEPSSSDSVPDT